MVKCDRPENLFVLGERFRLVVLGAPQAPSPPRAHSGGRPCSNRFVEPNSPDLQNRQAVAAPRSVGSTPALLSLNTCKSGLFLAYLHFLVGLPPCRCGKPAG